MNDEVNRNDRPLAGVLSTLVVSALLLGAPGGAKADAGDEARFERLLGRASVTEEEALDKLKPKALCICFGLNNHPGFVMVDSNGLAGCAIPQFTGGDLASIVPCDGDSWELLTN